LREAAEAARPFLEGTPLAELSDLVESAPLEELALAHVELFSVTAAPDCPAYETAFVGADLVGQTHRMAAIAGLYRMFGVELPPSSTRPDDISAELEFMSFLNCKEVYAEQHLPADRVAQAQKAQHLFLSEHLGCWASAFAATIVAAERSTPFYRRAAAALSAWVEADCHRTNAEPAMVATAPSLPPAGQVDHGPEPAPGAAFIPLRDIE
jgi:TorA maturation chaperone TorD